MEARDPQGPRFEAGQAVNYFLTTPIWKDETVAILASGPSMSQEVVDSVRHLPRIAINTTYQLARDAEIIYGADAGWWHEHAIHVEQLPGLKLTIEYRHNVYPNCPKFVQVLRWGGTEGFDDRPGYVRWGRNGGYQALHLAASLGAKRILLFGFDMHGGHWHGPHPKEKGLGNPRQNDFSRWIAEFGKLAPELAKRGIDVVNCTLGSKLNCFRQTDLAAAA